ncbi:PucR family transcriptional regulator [Ornithinimicrobium tianjinense]|uniref:PucR family transcriptional regulator n=1 Tax=Ornithinimicrobium tianjinense TaxID=1195761 RepID=A0A917BMT6_9MICO|nr:PucR family transcriptional regulator [Ornithinimicrobium tianjinense]GGF49000.1 PucR family transcriptional regulator [Ornithinimicrobium tianjinense]
MEAEHAWYRELSPDDRSWVLLISQAAINALLSWYAEGCPPTAVSGEMFASAPKSLAQTISLRQALDLTRTAIATVEDAVPDLVPEGEQAALREAVLRYSRDVAFAAAAAYAGAAERRGRWDARLESLVVHAVIRGEADDTLASRAAELGWEDVSGVAVVVGALPEGDSAASLAAVREAAVGLGREALTAAQGPRLVCILGGTDDPLEDAAHLSALFAPGPVVVGPRVPHLFAAGRSARAAISGADAAYAWANAPRPVAADELLAERALMGELPARRALVDRVYAPLKAHPSTLLETVQAYLDHGTVLEATARELFLHPNTVRYRLRRTAELVGLDPHSPRDAWVIQVAIALGRIGQRGRRR